MYAYTYRSIRYLCTQGRIAQSETCPIPTRSYTLVKIDHEIIFTAIILPSADSNAITLN